MKIYFVIIIIFIFIFYKNIEGLITSKKNSLISPENDEVLSNRHFDNKFTPPSSIGSGNLCPISAINKQMIAPCMNGFYCDNEAFDSDNDIGKCRIDYNKMFF